MPLAEFIRDHKHVGRGCAFAQAAQVRGLNRRPIGHRIGERHAQLYHIRTALDQRVEIGRGVAIASGDEAHERGVRLGEGV